MIVERTGDIFKDNAASIVIPVNCVGVMGYGLDLAAKRRWPGLYTSYRGAWARQDLNPGSLHVHDLSENRRVVCVATQFDQREPSRLEWVLWGLANLSRFLLREGIPSVALPALGCGAGGLAWDPVRAAIHREFDQWPQLDVRLYAPI